MRWLVTDGLVLLLAVRCISVIRVPRGSGAVMRIRMGCLGQYFPKGTDLGVHAAADLEFVAAQLNSRPRKTLGFDTPAERMAQLLGLDSNDM